MAEIRCGAFASQQVDRYGVVAKGVDDQKIVLLRTRVFEFAFERHSGVAKDGFDLCSRPIQIRKMLACKPYDVGVELIKSKNVTAHAVSGDRPRSQADDSHTQRMGRRAQVFERDSEGAPAAEVKRCPV